MENLLLDSEGCILVEFLEKGEMINAARYVQTRNKLRRVIRDKRQKKKTVILQHDNARPYTTCLTLQIIQNNGWELLSHPPYSPALAPSGYHLFGLLKDHLRGHHDKTDEAVQEALRS
jgi:histone-lysine N-methyltransferase SETMAR